MKIILQTKLAGFTPILAQTTGSLSSGASSALGIVMLIGFIFGTICVVGGGFAGLITQGMIDFMTDQSFLSSSSAPNTLYSLQNLMGLAFLGIWIIFSTIAAPVAIQKAIATGHSAVSSLFSGGFAAGRAAATAGATTFADGGAAGIKNAIAAGAMATAAATESLAASSMSDGHGSGGSLLGSLAQMNNRSHERERDKEAQNKPQGFPPNDPTGDKTVAGLIDKSRNSGS
jgi:hypothetical protein